jgi:hypothetical protein
MHFGAKDKVHVSGKYAAHLQGNLGKFTRVSLELKFQIFFGNKGGDACDTPGSAPVYCANVLFTSTTYF